MLLTLLYSSYHRRDERKEIGKEWKRFVVVVVVVFLSAIVLFSLFFTTGFIEAKLWNAIVVEMTLVFTVHFSIMAVLGCACVCKGL